MNANAWRWVALVGMTACIGFGCDQKGDDPKGGDASSPRTTEGQGDKTSPPPAEPRDAEAQRKLETLRERIKTLDTEISALHQKTDKSEDDVAKLKASQEEHDRIMAEIEKLLGEEKR